MNRPVVLIGPMGAGKSTLAPRVAEALGLPVLELDGVIEATAGKPIPRIFSDEGEAVFRALEKEALAEGLRTPAVIAPGGGALCNEAAWSAVTAAGAVVVELTAPTEVLTERTAGEGRPLLTGLDTEGRRARLEALMEDRQGWYGRAPLRVDTSASPEDVTKRIVEAVSDFASRTVPVRLGPESYTIRVLEEADPWAEVARGVAAVVPPTGAGRRLGLVSDETVAGLYAGALTTALTDEGYQVTVATFPAGEAHKTLATAETLLDTFLEADFQRGSPLVALGGGVTGDLTGFVASVLFRGGPVVQVPTTLLAMVDSAIGGKTGVNHPTGKNLIGAFHQPRAVLAPLATLASLPEREYRAGLGEVAKYALLDEDDLFPALEAAGASLASPDPVRLAPIVTRCAGLKATIVEADTREKGLRRLLNLGHTLGHALEAHTGYTRWLHGEAVALGLLAACRIGAGLGRCPADLESRIAALLETWSLPHDPSPLLAPEVVARVVGDKKAEGDIIHFVVPLTDGGAESVALSAQEIASLL